MTPLGHLKRKLNAVCIGMLTILLVFALPARRINAQPAETPGGELFEGGAESTSDNTASTPVDEAEQTPRKPRTELMADEKVEMSTEGNFRIEVQGIDLRMILRQLSQQAKKNIIVSKNVEGTVEVSLYDVTIQEALNAILKSNDLVSVEEGTFHYIYTAEEFADLRKMEPRIFRLFYIRAADAQKLIKGVLSEGASASITPPPEEGIVEAPIETKDWGGAEDHASEAIIVVYDYPENLERIAKIINEIDIRPEQVLIEATILAANLEETNSLGIDLQLLAGVDFSTFGMSSDLTGMTGGGVADFNHSQARLVTPFTNNFPSSAVNPMTIGFINNNVGVFLKALEGITDTTVLANPKLLVVNKQRGDILVGNKDGYITTTISQTVAIETVEFLETGTKLTVRPFIGKNGFIRMELHPEISRGQVSQITEGGPALPSKQTTEFTTNVLVRDGKTIVIAGLFRDQVVITRNQTPVLGNIPFLGQLFRSTVDNTIREEIIILLTPHIIEHESAELASERMRDDMERTRVGVRKGLQWFSRTKMADVYTRWARKDARNGDTSRAMWNVNLALSLEPKMIDAIRLKERLTQKAYWADQPAFISTRGVIRRMIMQKLGRPYEEVSYPTKPRDANKLVPVVQKRFGIGNRKHLSLDWPAPSSVSVEHMGEVELIEVQRETVVEPTPKPTVDVPVEDLIEEPVAEPAEEPIEEPIKEDKVETVEEPTLREKILEKPVEEPAPEPVLEEPVLDEPLEVPVTEDEIEPIEKPAQKTPEIKAVKPAMEPQSVDVNSPEPDFGAEMKVEPAKSASSDWKKASSVKAMSKNQKRPSERELRKSLVEELQRKSEIKSLGKASAGLATSKPAKNRATNAKDSAGSQIKTKKIVLPPAQIHKSSTAKSAAKPKPTTLPADEKVSWVEPRPLSEALQRMAKK